MLNIKSTERMAGDKMKKLFFIVVLVLGFALSLAYANIHILNAGVLRIGGDGGISISQSRSTKSETSYWKTARTDYWSNTRVALWSTERNAEVL